jgi:hypothetical protein
MGTIVRLLEFICNSVQNPRWESLLFLQLDPCAIKSWCLRFLVTSEMAHNKLFLNSTMCTDI